MSFSDNLDAAKARRREVPEGGEIVDDIKPEGGWKGAHSVWQPGVVRSTFGAEITSPPIAASPGPGDSAALTADWDRIFDYWGLSAADWIVDPTSFLANTWEVAMKMRDETGERIHVQRLHQYKAKLTPRKPMMAPGVDDLLDVDALMEFVLNGTPDVTVQRQARADSGTFLVLVGDVQIGKPDGDGSVGTFNRCIASLEGVIKRVESLRLMGVKLDRCTVVFMGDLIEQCQGNYDTQTFTVELNLVEQIQVMTRLIVRMLKALGDLFAEVTVGAIPGNHGEMRQGGKITTNYADNMDVYCVMAAADVLAESGRYDHIKFVAPEGNGRVLVLDCSGVGVGFMHGDVSGKGSDITARAFDWWRGQMEDNAPVGYARVLVTAHFHHVRAIQRGKRLHLQIPALDGGSEWWKQRTGQDSPPGIMSVVVGDGVGAGGAGWDHLHVA